LPQRAVPSGAEIVGLLLFGGSFFHNVPDEHTIEKEYLNAFEVASNKNKIVGYFKKIMFAPFTRNYPETNLCATIQRKTQ